MSNDPRGDESRARLGVFVVCGLLLAAAGVLALGWGRLFERTLPLHCYFAESVQGLEPGSPISYRGVKIGRVAEVRMAQVRSRRDTGSGAPVAIIAVKGELFADALASFGSRAPTDSAWQETITREVAQGLRVRVAWKDITGQKYLEVDYLDPEEYPPPILGIVPDLPYLPAAVSPSLQDIQKDLATTLGALSKVDYQRLGAQMQQLLEQVTQRVEEFRSDEVSASFRDAADALRRIAEDASLKQALVRFDAVGADAQTLLRRANDLLAKPELDTAVTDLSAAATSLRNVTASLESRLPDAVRQVETVATEARKAITDSKLPETAEAVRAGVRDVSGAARSVSAVREDLRVALRELGEASRNIGRLAEYLERHPESILSGRTGPGGTR